MFESLNEDRVSFAATLVKATPLVISTLQARRCIKDSASTYMAMIVDKSIESEEVCRIPIVEDFPKVFDNELPRLPLDKEIESGIELEPMMAPMHKAPYRMAPTELEEVKLH